MYEVVDKSVFHPIHHTLTHTKITDFFYSHPFFVSILVDLSSDRPLINPRASPFHVPHYPSSHIAPQLSPYYKDAQHFIFEAQAKVKL